MSLLLHHVKNKIGEDKINESWFMLISFQLNIKDKYSIKKKWTCMVQLQVGVFINSKLSRLLLFIFSQSLWILWKRFACMVLQDWNLRVRCFYLISSSNAPCVKNSCLVIIYQIFNLVGHWTPNTKFLKNKNCVSQNLLNNFYF